ncbi:MAG TPA: histidine kinase [Ideonella sp.]|nr:histidine kinase [Ideonella sp.]
MPDTLHAPAPSRWAAFRRVVCLPHVAAVFYLAFVFALSRIIAWQTEPADLMKWVFAIARYTRQSMISGFSILLCAGLAETALAGRGWSPRAAWALRGLAVAVGTLTGAGLRYAVSYWPDFKEPLEWSWLAYTSGLWWLLGCTGYGLLHLALIEHADCERLAAARQAREALAAQQLEAELSALQAQIEPHFLFNTLANVKRLYDVAPGRGRDMLASLIAYLQTALPGMRRQRATLGDELDRVQHYLAILQMRMGDRLRFDINAPAALRCAEMPPMVLATLVENAIKHGLSPLPEGGRLWVTAREADDGQLVVDVRDDGQGFVGAGGSGVGLANTRARLAALYGQQGNLALESAEPRGVLARVCLPLRRSPAAPAEEPPQGAVGGDAVPAAS